MPINVASYIKPRGDNDYYILEDVYLKGGFQIRTTLAELATINVQNLKRGMLVYVVETDKYYQLAADLATWNIANLGGSSSPERKTRVYSTDEIQVNGTQVVDLDIGNSVLIQSLSISVPMTVEAFETPDLTDTNQYKFVPTADHLSDDGTTLLANGETVKNRRYTILVNGENPQTGKIYFRLTNNLSTLATAATLTIVYLTLEN